MSFELSPDTMDYIIYWCKLLKNPFTLINQCYLHEMRRWSKFTTVKSFILLTVQAHRLPASTPRLSRVRQK